MKTLNAAVIGSGPNGLAAAIALADAGHRVMVYETNPTPGGAVRSEELTLPGFIHDVGSSVYPLGAGSPYFSQLGLEKHGLQWVWSPAELAHPFDDGTAALLHRDPTCMDPDWERTVGSFHKSWDTFAPSILSPLQIPRHPIQLAQFGLMALQPAATLAKTCFRDPRTQALFGGIAAHAILPLTAPLSSAIALVLAIAGHAVGWPVAKGGAQSLTNALVSRLGSNGRIRTGTRVRRLDELADFDLKMCDITPRQLLQMAEFRASFRAKLERFRYGPGIFKVDWALREPIPWTAKECAQAITVHLGGTLEEIIASEQAPWSGHTSDKPFVLLAQQSLFDPTRAPDGKHTAWAYCHVPNGWTGSKLEEIEAQVERFAPGFRECILARSTHTANEMEIWDENLIGGDINCGALTPTQLAFRPTFREYGTPLPGVYLCSSSTLPGGGVHGMCGFNAVQMALFNQA